jgi:hypothetical protein
MRKTLIASSLAALALGGLAGGAAFASESDRSPETPTTLAPGMDIFADMGLTPDQGACLVTNVGSVDINDMTALMELMTECGISADQLAEIGSTMTTAPATDDSTAAVADSLPADIDPATASAVLALLGLDQTAVDCLVSGSIGAPLDDDAAEQVFVGCGVGPAQVLEAIVALNTLAGAAGPVESVVEVVSSAPPVTSGNAMVDLLLEQLAAQGINLDATQGQCLLDNLSDFDPNDMAAMAAVFETCGIDIADLLPSG